jgi:hypothetical protein
LGKLALPGVALNNPELIEMAFGNSVPFVTTLKSFGPTNLRLLFSEDVLPLVELLSIVGGAFSTVMLFLIALGIRNRLRLR